MADYRTRRIRRACKARQKFGKAAKPRHQLSHGRTGSYHCKLTPSRARFGYQFSRPSIPLSEIWNVG